MNLEKAIAEIEWLERLYLLLDTRPLQLSDRCAANQRHDEMNANNPWFRLRKRYGDFGTLIWPHFGRLIWPHLIYSDRSSYPVPASRDGEGDGQETQGGTV